MGIFDSAVWRDDVYLAFDNDSGDADGLQVFRVDGSTLQVSLILQSTDYFRFSFELHTDDHLYMSASIGGEFGDELWRVSRDDLLATSLPEIYPGESSFARSVAEIDGHAYVLCFRFFIY